MTVNVRADAPSAQVETVPPDGVRSPAGARWRKPLGIAALVMIPVLMYLGLVFAPEDVQQGPAQRIFYIHVPAAWIGFLAFFVVFVTSIAFLATKDRKWDDIASS
jgi:heme exporter protein C